MTITAAPSPADRGQEIEAMSENKPRSTLATIATWLFGLIVFCVLYVLSAGPISWLAVHHMLPGPASIWETIYKPLGYIEA
jgi:hypothetical protein